MPFRTARSRCMNEGMMIHPMHLDRMHTTSGDEDVRPPSALVVQQ
ncbi:MAG: hypothetical protein ACXW61_18820 [Gemmatirosa sp.]